MRPAKEAKHHHYRTELKYIMQCLADRSRSCTIEKKTFSLSCEYITMVKQMVMSRYREDTHTNIATAIPLCIIFAVVAVAARNCVRFFRLLARSLSLHHFQLDSILLYVVVDDGEYCAATADMLLPFAISLV